MLKLKQKVFDALNRRLNDEYFASYFYRSAMSWCKNSGFDNCAEFFHRESESELDHARKIENYLTSWRRMPELKIIPEPEDFKDLRDVFQKAYQIEEDLYNSYESDAREVFNEDICCFSLLQDMLNIQIKSISEYINLLDKIDMSKDMLWFDQEIMK